MQTNEDHLKDDDDLQNEDNLKNEDDLKNKDNLNLKTVSDHFININDIPKNLFL